uniref:Putative rubber elongation factor n=1 Tax=Davidia involucrata TaxID=16924 RepID=A0A5B7BLN5_DAVIN
MAEADPKSQPEKVESEEEEERLKYLEFVQVAAVQAVLCLSGLYGYAKDNCGPLKPGVETVEGTVRTVVGPVYDKFHDVPIQVLKFVDRKVDESLNKLGRHVPLVDTASGLVKTVYTKCEPAATEFYSKYEPVAEQYAVSAWRTLHRLPLFPQVAHVLVPTAAYCSEKYNETVRCTTEKGYKFSAYLPLVPTKKIAEVFREGEAEPLVSSG